MLETIFLMAFLSKRDNPVWRFSEARWT